MNCLRSAVLFSFFLLWVLSGQALLAVEEATVVSFQGHLDKETLVKSRQVIESAKKEGKSLLALEVNSSSGDLNEVLEVAKRLYELKQQQQAKITVFIHDNALGPAAIFPFLADELWISHFVSWGDIPLGSDSSLATNILKSRVTSFISPEAPKADILRLLAQGMSDPSLQITKDGEWKIAKSDALRSIVSEEGQALVVNHHQMVELGLVSAVMTADQFYDRFRLSEAEKELLKAPEQAEGRAVTADQPLDERLKASIKYQEQKPNAVGHILINDRSVGINQATWLYVKTALDYYKKTKPAFIILELDTPGGEVYAAQKISDALKELDTQYNIPVVAFINNWAISAGAMLAYSCRFIAIVKDASMGAAEPVLAGAEGQMQTASEKINSALRADFANRARFFGRNSLLAEAMVDKDIILVLRHGKIVKLDSEEQIRTKGLDRDVVITAKGKLLTLNAEQLMQYGVADMMLLPEKLELITEQEREAGKWPASKMLLFQHPFFQQIPNATIDSFGMDWKTQFFVILANPIVSSMLVLGLLIGFYVEINTPGFGVPGAIALACLFLILLSSFSLQLVNWLEVILLLVGVVMIAVDLFLIPTFGVIGVIGVLLVIAGLFGMMLPAIGTIDFDFDTNTLNAAGEVFFERLVWLCGAFVLSVVAIALMGRYVMPTFSGFQRFVLSGEEQDAALGYVAGEDPSKLPQPGTKGEVLSPLRPAGKVIIQDVVYDAVSDGSFIEKGAQIIVERLEGSKIVVISSSTRGEG